MRVLQSLLGHLLVKADVGLDQVDNTSDANKPVSTAQATAIGLKADASALTAHTGNVSNPHAVTKAQVGLGSVDNTSDAGKPVSTAQAASIATKADDAATTSALAGKQPLNSNLTAFAAIAPAADGSFLGRSGGAYAMRSAANTKVDLSLDKVLNIKDNYSSAVPPTVSNDSSQGYSVGSRWVDTLTHIAYYCASASVGAALWVKLNFISSVSAPLVESGGGLTLPAAAGPSTDGYLLGADKAKIDALTMYNLLINPGMEVKQRTAASFTVSGSITLDAWLLALGGASTATVTQITSTIGYPGKSMQIVYTHAAAGYVIQAQDIEQYLLLRGKPVAFAATVKCSVASRVHLYISDGVLATYSSYNAGTGEERLTVTHTPGAATTILQVAILADLGNVTVEVNDATLVAGSYPAAFVPLNPQEEMERCERRYQILQCTARFTAAAGGHIMETPIPFRVPMAGTPSTTIVADGLTANQTASYPQIFSISDHGGRWAISAAAAGDCYSVLRSVILEYNP
jgi:hypothetical protein